MEQSKFSVFWNNHYKQFLLLFIRLTEVFMSSIVPSFIGVVLIFINPNQRIWDLMSILSMIGFSVINCRFLLKYVASRGNRKVEFYVINGIVYLTYSAVSIIAYHFFGYLLYSMIFANLRVFEIFHLKTIYSVYLSDALIILTMLVFRGFAYRHVDFIRKVIGIDVAEDSELERYYSGNEAVQNNQSVNILSLEEMNDNIINEIKEAHEVYLRKYDKTPDTLWNDIEKGDGSEIEYATPKDPDDDYDENDRVAANNINPHEQYEAGSLWNDIYKGTEKVENYDDELTPPPVPEKRSRIKELRDEVIWHLRSFNKLVSIKHNYQRNELMLREIRSKTIGGVNVNKNYDSDELWESGFYQGNDEDKLPDKILDFDDTPEVVKQGLLFESYDSDKLWDLDLEQYLSEEDAENEVSDMQYNPNEDYESDSLWSMDMKQGDGKVMFAEKIDDNREMSQNPNEEYESDSLWSADLKQGR